MQQAITRTNIITLYSGTRAPLRYGDAVLPVWGAHCGDGMVVRSSYLRGGISYPGGMASLNWIEAQTTMSQAMKYCQGLLVKSSVWWNNNQTWSNDSEAWTDKFPIHEI